MKNLQQLVDSYVQMDQRRRGEAVARMRRIAKSHPMRTTPMLNLVVDNTRGLGLAEVDSSVHDLRAPVLVGGVIKG